MAGGWSRDGAVQDQIDASLEDAVRRVGNRLPAGEGLSRCEVCDAEIPGARRKAVPGVRLCINCQAEVDKENTSFAGINRQASKASQLR